VVLPLLRDAFVTRGWVSDDAFLAGYGPRPCRAAVHISCLGTVVGPTPHRLAGAALGLIGIFVPSILMLGTFPLWE
jgi:chromate transporter